MKKIENKKVDLAGKQTTYAKVIKICNEIVPEKGWTPSSMAQAIKIDSICKEENETIELEDADFDFIKKIIENMKWSIKDIAIINFCKDINEIK